MSTDEPGTGDDKTDVPDSETPDTDAPDRGDTDPDHATAAPARRSPALIATIVAIPVMVVVLFIVFAAAKNTTSPGPLPLQSAAAPTSGDQGCARLIAALPQKFENFGERTESDGLVQWAKGGDSPGPIQLRCGVPRPDDLAPTSALQTVDPVQWFQRAPKEGEKGALWFAVDHRPYVALWLPNNSGNGAISDVSKIIEQILPLAPIDLGS